ncbi:O-methyltransferase [Streptomyces sp. NBC_00257]|uniref:O-methyltransferase n=1 Tax=unclassified Streptomyces TaxID=2593676 RepID=UPI00225C1EA5|nr:MULTISPECIES: O-methyltransferase [unclassified Streptomyces]MCX5426345.1 O-methyltransferase [Streptomyces sp. NBC_00062]WTB59383.1 O-methyltransferase [Streptomyces sp. NBC_00826]WTH87747.1 O-methyltransferase [Streptomyces sp. NBC_00825]WTH96472.1 O-methyltransferase [Streptomyces sp. NBC_00822]
MNQDQWTAIDSYTNGLLISHDPALEEASGLSAEAGLRDVEVAPNQGMLLHLLAQIGGARPILEIGTFGDYSTIWLARALPAGGKLITIESGILFARSARDNIERAGLRDIVDQRVGKALDILPEIEAEGAGPFDLFFIDADKARIPEYFTWALKLSRPGSVIVVDNVVLGGTLVDPASTDPAVAGSRGFHELLAGEPRVTATTVQTVGTKGYDGFTLAVVNG